MEAVPKHAGSAPRRTSLLDVRCGVRPLHAEGSEWVVSFSASPFVLALVGFDLTQFFPIRAVSASI